MSIITSLKVALAERSYPIYIGQDLLTDAALLQKYIAAEQVMIVSNETVAKLYLPTLLQTLSGYKADTVIVPDGEQYKTLATWASIFDELLLKKHHRNTTLIALGGGVICDMTGFAAACYQRGAHFLQIPTTLLAQVDASIGGKTAVNHPAGKNMIGAFYQPRAVIIDLKVLDSLPDREYSAGLAEIIKAAAIRDAEFFAWLEKKITTIMQRQPEPLSYAIARACEIKAEIVSQDEKEVTGERALLNFGHTFGHAIENIQGYGNILHGEAVAIGMMLAARLSLQQGWLVPEEVGRLEQLLTHAKLPTRLPPDTQYDKMMTAMAVDKKFTYHQKTFILLQGLGKAKLTSQIEQRMLEQILT